MEQKFDLARILDKTVDLARLLLSFGLIERAIHHEDGKTKESDTTHTVMLGVMAAAFAERYAPALDRGLIAQFALVHDLVEVYAGDTVSFGKLGGDAGKDEREHAALLRLKKEFGDSYPWIAGTIEQYERLDTREARYVKTFDKVLPKIAHFINGGVTVRELGGTHASTSAFHERQFEEISRSYGSDQPEVLALMQEVNALLDGPRGPLYGK